MATSPEKSDFEIIKSPSEKSDITYKQHFKMSSLGKVSKLSWMCVIYFSISANCFHQFMNIAMDLYKIRFEFDQSQAKNAVAIIRFLSVVFIPLISLIITKVGKKGYFMILASILAIANPLVLAFIPRDHPYLPYLGVVGLCLFWSVQVSSVWPSMSISMPKQAVVIMIGIGTALQNLFGAVLPVIIGSINNQRTPASYQKSLFVLSYMGVIILVLSVFITLEDSRTGRIIDIPENDERVRDMRVKLNLDFDEVSQDS